MKVSKEINLKTFNTFKMGVTASCFAVADNIDGVLEIFSEKGLSMLPTLILGGGSNILFTKNYHGLVIKNEIMGINILHQDGADTLVRAGAGVVWHDLVLYSILHNLGGLENLSLIPGTVGASPIQNIGAYGVELKDVFDHLEAVEIETLQKKIFYKKDCRFGYRESVFKKELAGKYIITSVTFRLSTDPILNTSYGAISDTLIKSGINTPTIRDISDAVCKIRRSKLPDPSVLGNAGSFFKNPEITVETYERLKSDFPNIPHYKVSEDKVKIPAGWLNEACGWKGKQIGNVGVHKDQALVLVNYGGAEGSEVKILSEKIQSSVYEKFGIQLETEVNIL